MRNNTPGFERPIAGAHREWLTSSTMTARALAFLEAIDPVQRPSQRRGLIKSS
jgi:hypothetical protein